MKNWQVQLGGWGTVLWAAAIFNVEIIRDKDWEVAYQITNGYIIGFITAFSAYLFWEIMHGRWKKLVGEEQGLWRYVSAIPLIVITAVGALGFLSSLLGSFTWQYNLGFILAGVVVAQGLVSIINEIDGEK